MNGISCETGDAVFIAACIEPQFAGLYFFLSLRFLIVLSKCRDSATKEKTSWQNPIISSKNVRKNWKRKRKKKKKDSVSWKARWFNPMKPMKPKTTRPLQRKTRKKDHEHQRQERAMAIREHAKDTLSKNQTGFREGQKVALLISTRTEMGYVAVVNGTHKGILYKNEVFQPLKIGQEIDGFIKKIRDDKKLDLSLQKSGYKTIDILSKKIMEKLLQDGFIAVTDKSQPKIIADLFGVSKKIFKKSIGNLYKKRLITLEKDGIRLQDKPTNPVKTAKTRQLKARAFKTRMSKRRF